MRTGARRSLRPRLLLTGMDLVAIYDCLCDRTRLRLVHLLLEGPLCVCHFQEVLRVEQVKVSKHLAYLRRHRLVVAARAGSRRVYRLPDPAPAALAANLACVRACAAHDRYLRADARRLRALRARLDPAIFACAAPVPRRRADLPR